MQCKSLKQKVKTFLFMTVNKITAFKFRYIRGVDIGGGCNINRKVKIDAINPKGIHIGDYVRIFQNALVLVHDAYRDGFYLDTYIGNRVNISYGAVVDPGLRIGNCVIIGTNAIVIKDIP